MLSTQEQVYFEPESTQYSHIISSQTLNSYDSINSNIFNDHVPANMEAFVPHHFSYPAINPPASQEIGGAWHDLLEKVVL